MVKISAANHALPDQLFLDGVKFGDLQNPWRTGGFADVFEGTYSGTKIVGKRLRVYGIDKTEFHSASPFFKFRPLALSLMSCTTDSLS
jgi:hypothetical protein